MTTTPQESTTTSSARSTTESRPITASMTPPTTTSDQSQKQQQQQDKDDDEWNKRLQELQDFKTRHGHSIVPPSWSEHVGLSEWVYTQRTAATQECLSNAQKIQLEQLGIFLFNQKDQKWHEMFHRLYQFWKVTGHFQIPGHHQSTELNTLRTWLTEQRRYFRRGTLRSDRKVALEAIGFLLWNPRSKNGNPSSTSTATTPLCNGNDNAPSQQQQQRSIKRTDNDTVISFRDEKRQKTATTTLPESVVSMVEEIPPLALMKKPSTVDPPPRHCAIVSVSPLQEGTTTAADAVPKTRPIPTSLATITTTPTFPSHHDSTATTTTTTSVPMTDTAVSPSKDIIAAEKEEEEGQQEQINPRSKKHEGQEGDSNQEEKEDQKETELSSLGMTTSAALPRSEPSNLGLSPKSPTSSSCAPPRELKQAPDQEEQQPSHEHDEQQEQQEQQPQNPQGDTNDDDEDDEYIQVTPNLCAALLFSFHAQHFHFNIHPNDEPCYTYLQAIRSGQMVPDDAVRLALLLKGFVFDDHPDSTRDLLEHGMQQFLAHQINTSRKSHPTTPATAAATATAAPTEMPQWLCLWQDCVRQGSLPMSRTKKSYLTAVGFDWGRDEVIVEEEK
jgi:Helicase associated domain